MMKETARRTLARAITYRLVSVALTLMVAYWYSGDLSQATAFAFLSQGVVSVWYYVHERLWLRVRWGLPPSPAAVPSEQVASKRSSA